MRCAAYLRVSTTRQAEEGLSLAAQLHAIRQSLGPGDELVKVYEDPR